MARDLSLAVRQAIVAALEDSPAVAAIVPAERIYAVEVPAEPVWPFIRYGLATALPFRASGMDGCRLAVTLYGFAHGPQEDAVATLGGAIAATLDGRVMPIDVEPPATAHVGWTSSRTLRDSDEAGAYHVILSLDVTLAG